MKIRGSPPRRPTCVCVYSYCQRSRSQVAVTGQTSEHISSKPVYHILRKLSDQEKLWVPHKECNQCVESLWMWTKGTWISWQLVYLGWWRGSKIVAQIVILV